MTKAWNEKVVIPTYEIGVAEKCPVFAEKRVYQGSSGKVYPYPVVEKISDWKFDKIYDAVFLENEYLKIMILPQLGGRIQMAYDKIKKRHFVYYNQVIKPALVGLTGPWISGGIEFNWPQHHRPSTFLPVDWCIEDNSDGSVTVWVSEIERMFHQKGMAGFTLYPGKAFLEIKGRLYNRTAIPQTFLWWANPAVAVNDDYQSVFPPDVNAVFDHGKRDVSTFPIATGTYYKVDYSAGVDISRYKNIPVPTSFMAVDSRYDFMGGYENDTHAGMLHVSNHHLSPGKKQWTWGNGDFGHAWDRNLTDENGPYIELMAGVFTDNQPDFSWLQPYEEKSFTQYFLPYRELGVVKNANKDLLLNMEENGENEITIKVFATSRQQLTIVVKQDEIMLLHEEAVLSPEKLYQKSLHSHLPFSRLRLVLYDKKGREALSWCPQATLDRAVPQPAKPALLPHEIENNEELYLTGLHLEQYRHATYDPRDYYLEALKRDPSDARCNNAMGLWYYRNGRADLAEPCLRRSIATLTRHNPNPYDGEPYYNLGLVLKAQGRNNEAYDAFYKSCWNSAWQDAGYLSCAQISAIQGRFEEALDEVEHSMIRNWHNHKSRHLRALLLRKAGRVQEAEQLCKDSLALDRFNYGCLFELYLITGKCEYLNEMKQLMRKEAGNYLEVARDYAAAGQWTEGILVLNCCIGEECITPMTACYTAYFLYEKGENEMEMLEKAASLSPDYCFPNDLEDIHVLQWTIEKNPKDGKAAFYLGNLWYDKRQYQQAVQCWETSALRDASYPIVWRNLALAYYNKMGCKEKAVDCLERAFHLDPCNARMLMELDQLYKKTGRSQSHRLEMLDKYPKLVNSRDDLYLERITLLNQLERYSEAKQMLDERVFHPWEGGEGKVTAQYQYSRCELAKGAIAAQRYADAILLLEECLVYPPRLGEGKLAGARENDFFYFLGMAYEGLNRLEKAREYWTLAARGNMEPAAAVFYNDQKPDKIFYQGMALLKLGDKAAADEKFNKLIAYGKKHLCDEVKVDYFAVSLPDLQIWDGDLNLANRVHCNYLIALGLLGLNDERGALQYLKAARTEDENHQGLISLNHLIEKHLV